MDYLEKSKLCAELEKKEKGFYIYCIVLGTAVIEEHKGIDGLGSLFATQYRKLTAVVSEVELDTFKSRMPAAGEEIDMEWVEEKARTHEEIVERLMKENALLPARFCSIVRKKEDIIAYLADNYLAYERALERLQGREEWAVKASFLIQRKIDNLIKERMDKRLEAIRPHIVEILRDASEHESISDVKFYKQQQIENPLVFKAAYLVEKNLFHDFNHKFKKLSTELEPEGIRLVVSGPWPPYSFVEDEKESDIERSLVRLLFPIR